jgi:hypothetical protein
MNIRLSTPNYLDIKVRNQKALDEQMMEIFKKQKHIHGHEIYNLVTFFLKKMDKKEIYVVALIRTNHSPDSFVHSYVGKVNKWRKKEFKNFYFVEKSEKENFDKETKSVISQFTKKTVGDRIKKLEL